MDFITQTKEVPVVGSYDVVVCGGGPAGLIAAIAAARGGARTALVERYGFLGGMATAGLVAPISVFNYNGRRIVGGIPWEFVERLSEIGGAEEEKPLGNITFSPEKYKLVAQRMLLEAGVTLYFHSYLTGCRTKEGRISHVVIENKNGAEALVARYFIDATGDADLALRFDLTVPLAKYVALHYNDLSFPFRRYQIGKVYRGERAQRGRFREFYQADIDVIGDGELDITNDAEIPAIIYDVFSAMGLKRFQIRINNRRILNGFYAMLGLSDKSGDIMRTVDKIEKIGPDLVRAILVDDYAIEGEKADEILAFIGIKGTNEEVLASLEKYRGRNEMFDQGLDELTTVAKYLGAFGVPQENFAVDLTIARGLDYYTGTVYETTLLDHPEIGSVCSGGRYDNLAEYYTDRKLPGVGISIGVTRLFYVLGEQGLLNDDVCTAPADVLILPMTEDLSEAISLATDLRAAGVSTQIYTEKKKFKAKMNYADKLKVPYVYFLGEDEINAGVVSCKDMRTGEQVKLPRAEAVEKAKAFVEGDKRKPVILEKK